MRLKNYTDIPDDWLRAVIREIRPNGISNFDVRLSNSAGSGWGGRAYWAGSGYHDRASPFIVVRIARDGKFKPHIYKPHRSGYLPHVWGNRREAVIWLLAHELRHLWQANHERGKVYGARGRFSERDADAYALQILRRYRRGELALNP